MHCKSTIKTFCKQYDSRGKIRAGSFSEHIISLEKTVTNILVDFKITKFNCWLNGKLMLKQLKMRSITKRKNSRLFIAIQIGLKRVVQCKPSSQKVKIVISRKKIMLILIFCVIWSRIKLGSS